MYRWLDGEIASERRIGDLTTFATTLAGFLVALRRVDASDGPGPGRHNFFRGGPLRPTRTRRSTRSRRWATRSTARRRGVCGTTRWPPPGDGEPVWFHGDVAEGNLLLRDGRLAAVIDFGTSGVGDPACDAVIAWTLLSGPSRDAFRAALGVDPGTWSRGRGWGLWKALITLAGELERDPGGGALQRRVIDRVLADHAREA